MNPYRSTPAAIRSRVTRFFRMRSLARFAVVLLAGGAFASGWALGRKGQAPSDTSPFLGCPASTEPAPAPAVEATEAAPQAAQADEEQPRKRYDITPAQARATIAVRAREALRALARRDFRTLATFVDADEGLRIGELSTDVRAELSRVQLASCLEDRTRRVWGVEDLSDATCNAYWRQNILAADWGHPSHVDYNLPSTQGEPASMLAADSDQSGDPTLAEHRDAIVVQVVARRPLPGEPDADSSSWTTLRLVWRPHGDEWRMAELSWREWTRE
jgi:hypothetical protein